MTCIFLPAKRIAMRRRVTGVVALLLIGCLFASSACDLNRIADDVNLEPIARIRAAGEILDAQALVRSIIFAISTENGTERFFDKVPAAQRAGLSFTALDLYFSVLARMCEERGTVEGFRMLSGQERERHIARITEHNPQYGPLAEATVPVELIFSDEQDVNDMPMYLYFQQDNENKAYVSAAWVRQCNALFDYSSHYFNALYTRNEDALITLIEPGYVERSDYLSTTIMDKKAKALIDYYAERIQSQSGEFLIDTWDIASLTYRQANVFDERLMRPTDRIVVFYYIGEIMMIDEPIDTLLHARDTYLYLDGRPLLRAGEMVSQRQVIDLFGEPFQLIVNEDYASKEGMPGDLVLIAYHDLMFTILGTKDEDSGVWEGKIYRIRLRETDAGYSIGRQIRSGMSREDVLAIYPFADHGDYVLDRLIDGVGYSLTFVFDEEHPETLRGAVLTSAWPD